MVYIQSKWISWSESFVHKTTTTEDEARLDIKANGLWDSRFCRTFFDVKIFNPLAKSCPKDINEAYKFHETQKKLKYESRIINVEKSTFNPLVFACTGGAGPSATKVITRLASKVNEKSTESYSEAISYIRTKISFALLRSCVLCLRGCRSTRCQPAMESSISAVVHEGGLSWTLTILRVRITLESTPFFVFFGHSIKLRYDDLFYKSSSTCRCFQNLFLWDRYWHCKEALQLAAFWHLFFFAFSFNFSLRTRPLCTMGTNKLLKTNLWFQYARSF